MTGDLSQVPGGSGPGARPESYDDTSFARIVSLAAHDLRTPLATIFGFSRTLGRDKTLTETQLGYVGMIETATAQLDELLAELSLVSRIEAGRYRPRLVEADSLELTRHAEETLGTDRVHLSGTGGPVQVDVDPVKRAVSALIQATLRHGALEEVWVVVDGPLITTSPVTKHAEPVVAGREIRALSAASAIRLITFLGGSVTVEDDRLLIRLPA